MDPWEVIGGRSSPHNGLRNLRYIHYKIWYILNKICYIQSSGHQDSYIIIHGPFVPLETHEKVIGGHFSPKMDFGTLGISFTKFGTSNSRDTNTLILLPIVCLFL